MSTVPVLFTNVIAASSALPAANDQSQSNDFSRILDDHLLANSQGKTTPAASQQTAETKQISKFAINDYSAPTDTTGLSPTEQTTPQTGATESSQLTGFEFSNSPTSLAKSVEIAPNQGGVLTTEDRSNLPQLLVNPSSEDKLVKAQDQLSQPDTKIAAKDTDSQARVSSLMNSLLQENTTDDQDRMSAAAQLLVLMHSVPSNSLTQSQADLTPESSPVSGKPNASTKTSNLTLLPSDSGADNQSIAHASTDAMTTDKPFANQAIVEQTLLAQVAEKSYLQSNTSADISNISGSAVDQGLTETSGLTAFSELLAVNNDIPSLPNGLHAPETTVRTPESNLPHYPIHTSLYDKNWSQDVGHRISWLIGQETQSAVLTINPENLGSVQIQIQMEGQKIAHVQFFSPHTEVRQALSNALPVLDSLLSGSGINLGQTNVGSDSSSAYQSPNQQSGPSRQASSQEPMPMAVSTWQSTGLINTRA